jgi:hypothetical protein
VTRRFAWILNRFPDTYGDLHVPFSNHGTANNQQVSVVGDLSTTRVVGWFLEAFPLSGPCGCYRRGHSLPDSAPYCVLVFSFNAILAVRHRPRGYAHSLALGRRWTSQWKIPRILKHCSPCRARFSHPGCAVKTVLPSDHILCRAQFWPPLPAHLWLRNICSADPPCSLSEPTS